MFVLAHVTTGSTGGESTETVAVLISFDLLGLRLATTLAVNQVRDAAQVLAMLAGVVRTALGTLGPTSVGTVLVVVVSILLMRARGARPTRPSNPNVAV